MPVVENTKIYYTSISLVFSLPVLDMNTRQSPVNTVKASARQLTTMELLQTEKNYVGILSTILKVMVLKETVLSMNKLDCGAE